MLWVPNHNEWFQISFKHFRNMCQLIDRFANNVLCKTLDAVAAAINRDCFNEGPLKMDRETLLDMSVALLKCSVTLLPLHSVHSTPPMTLSVGRRQAQRRVPSERMPRAQRSDGQCRRC